VGLKAVNKGILTAGAVAVAGVAGYFGFTTMLGGAPAGYTETNIDLGATAVPDVGGVCPALSAHPLLVCLADALKARVTPQVLAELQRPYTVGEAQKWSNFPPVGYPDRVGPILAAFTPDQRGIIKAMLMEAASLLPNEGYDELEQILNADDFLQAETADTAGFSSGNYHIAFLGTPGPTGTWQLYFGGHHLAFANTYTDGVLAGATPSFRGVEPFVPFTQNGRENAPMVQELGAFAAALGGLTADEQEAARLAEAYTDIIAGPQKDDAIPTAHEGLRLGDLTAAQQAAVIVAIETYVRDVAAADADRIMARYAAELPETFIAFSGTPTLDSENDYVRVDGPSVWIEISMQPGRSVEGIHPHSVWRDKTQDYGGNE
jgi:Protein of unknown function (DUF3500)